MAFEDTARSFLWRHKRGRTCISVSGVFAILILWQARLSGRNVVVCRQTADNTSALSHVFPLERASIQGFVFSIIVYICLLSWFKLRLSAYSSPVVSQPLLLPPFTFRLHLCSTRGTEVSAAQREKSERRHLYLLSMNGHSAKVGKMYGGDWKRDMGGVMEAEGSIISAGWVVGNFLLKVRGQIYLFPWKLQWNFTEYFALMMRKISGHKFVLPVMNHLLWRLQGHSMVFVW